MALASLVSLVAAACSGEHANSPRDASALAGAGGKGGAGSSGNAGTSGDGGSTGVGTAGTGGDGGGGTGGAGAGGTGGIRPTGTGIDGSTCSTGGDCMSSWCVDTICCATECAGACMVCNATGVCEPAMDGTNPRGMCAVTGATSCGTTGVCNGSGACRYHPSGQVCSTTPSCDSTNSSVVTRRVCNGSGSCEPSTSQSCNGYRCAAAACTTTCSADTDCAPNAFCSASACYPNGSVNLAGNGDLETGSTNGWGPANFSGTIALSAVASSGVSHSGGYSVVGNNRTLAYQGPAYTLPSGPGKYVISAWGLQRDMVMIAGALQVRLTCMTSTSYVDVAYGVTMSQNIWTSFSSTIDTTKFGVDCLPTGAAPGLVRSASLYLNHPPEVPSPFPNLYLDDLVVQVTDGHNLVGNPNFEAGLADGWSLSAGSSTVTIDTTAAHGGTKSLHQSGRSIPAAGPRWVLPTGTARYAFSFWVRHAPAINGDAQATYDLVLQPTYNCITPSGAVTPPAIATAMAVQPNTWVELKGTGTFPPADAPKDCKLLLAAVYVRQEGTACTGPCPDLFVDDVEIKLAQ